MSSKISVSHEYCQGYVDKNGIWNNGFYCRRWGGQNSTYCCGDGQERFCCPEMPHLITPTAESNSRLPADTLNYIHVAIGVCIVVVVVFVVVMTTTFCCLFFSFCPVKKKQRLRKQMTPFNGTLPFCTEAEATSSVIAAEALQVPFRDLSLCTSTHFTGTSTAAFFGGQSPTSSFDQRRRCEAASGSRPWSPATSLGTADDLESTITSSLYHRTDIPDVSWHAEVQNLCNCELRPILKLEPKRNDKTNVLVCSTGNTDSFKNPTGYPLSAWRLDPHGAKGTLPRKTRMDEGAPPLAKQTTFELTYQRTNSFPASVSSTNDVVVSSSSASAQGNCWQSKLLRLPMMSFAAETDRHKRDSGVLDVEDGSDNGGSPVCAGPTAASGSEDQLATARGSAGPRSVYAWRGNS